MAGLIFFLWLPCVVIAAIIGNKKKNVLPAVIAGLLLGPLGIGVAFLLPDKRRTCPRCGHLMDPEDVFCSNCHREVGHHGLARIPGKPMY